MRFRKSAAVIAAATALALSVGACSSSKKSSGGGGSSGSSSGGSSGGDCAAFSAWNGHKGKTVTIYAGITSPDDAYLKKSWSQFESCTGITIKYQADKQLESQIKIRVQGGNAPDISIFAQPGLLQTFVKQNSLKVVDSTVAANVAKNWSTDWAKYATVDGKLYGSPFGANVKSLVWYSPKEFKAKGYTVPTTWDDMLKLSDKIVADGNKPWCVGIESGTATGWVLTDWMEEVMLRLYGPDVYDQWVNHTIPFNDPKVVAVLNKVGDIVKNDKYVNAGIGDVKSIATTNFAKAGLPIQTGKCFLHAQASFYGANWDKKETIGPDGDIYAFYEPPINTQFPKPVEGGGEFVVAFSDKPEVQAVQEYLSTADWANSRIKAAPAGDWTTANKNIDASLLTDPVQLLSHQILIDPQAQFRFDGSDLMPSSVGAGTFWTQMTKWILGQDTNTTLTNVENSWPK